MLTTLRKQNDVQTPIILRIGIIIQILFLLGPLSSFINAIRFETSFDFWILLSFAVQLLALIALWNMHRWGVIAIALTSVIGSIMVWTKFGHFPVKATVLFLAVRGLVLVPALIYWNRMTR